MESMTTIDDLIARLQHSRDVAGKNLPVCLKLEVQDDSRAEDQPDVAYVSTQLVRVRPCMGDEGPFIQLVAYGQELNEANMDMRDNSATNKDNLSALAGAFVRIRLLAEEGRRSCEDAMKALPEIHEIADRMHNVPGMMFIGISCDAMQLLRHGQPWPTGLAE